MNIFFSSLCPPFSNGRFSSSLCYFKWAISKKSEFNVYTKILKFIFENFRKNSNYKEYWSSLVSSDYLSKFDLDKFDILPSFNDQIEYGNFKYYY